VVRPRQSSDIDAFRRVNTVISNLKTAIRSTYHHVNVHTCLARDLSETHDRLNRRFDLPSLVGRLLHADSMAAFAHRPAPRHGCAWPPSARSE
jgi:hypothetical protein